MAGKMNHFDRNGSARMVDVSDKAETERFARATCRVRMKPATVALVTDGACAKGDVMGVARLAGIMAVKKTGDLIPLCHPLPITAATVNFAWEGEEVLVIEAEVRVVARTGVEMEALTAATVAGLTVYDMCKSVDRTMTIETIRLEEKSGGRSGSFRRTD